MSDPSHTYFIAKLHVVLRFSFCVFHASLKTVTWKVLQFYWGNLSGESSAGHGGSWALAGLFVVHLRGSGFPTCKPEVGIMCLVVLNIQKKNTH